MLKTLFEIIARWPNPRQRADVRTQRLDGLRTPESLSDIKALAEPAYSEERRHPGRVSIATPEAARGPSAAPRPVKRAAAGGVSIAPPSSAGPGTDCPRRGAHEILTRGIEARWPRRVAARFTRAWCGAAARALRRRVVACYFTETDRQGKMELSARQLHPWWRLWR
jgi:hypothetical protein